MNKETIIKEIAELKAILQKEEAEIQEYLSFVRGSPKSTGKRNKTLERLTANTIKLYDNSAERIKADIALLEQMLKSVNE